MTSDEMLDHENQRMTENLAGKVSQLKNLAFDIEQDTRDHNTYLDSMGGDFESGQSLLGGSMGRIQNMVSSGKNNRKLMCYIIGGLVGLFILAYYFISRVTAG